MNECNISFRKGSEKGDKSVLSTDYVLDTVLDGLIPLVLFSLQIGGYYIHNL